MVDLLSELSNGLTVAVLTLWADFLRVLPGLFGALLLIIVGIALGIVLKRIVTRILEETKIDQWIEEQKLKAAIGNHHVSHLIGSFTKWYVIAIFLAQAVALIQLNVLRQFTEFFITLVNSGIAALILLMLGLLLARWLRNHVDATDYKYKKTIGAIVEILIIYVTIVLALQMVGINTTILIDAFRIGFTVLVIALAVIAGVLFALAFKKDIIHWADEIRKEASK
ncbi:MAG: hypothetical protein V1777_02060 [Candidatus Micrarchaeota archaeon]